MSELSFPAMRIAAGELRLSSSSEPFLSSTQWPFDVKGTATQNPSLWTPSLRRSSPGSD